MGQKGLPPENRRITEAVIDPVFTGRWSPRAFDPAPLPHDTVRSIFEAAKWAPSCMNEQPWLFLYAVSKADLALYLELLVDGNKVWAKTAPLLAFLFARRTFASDNSKNNWAAFDCGAAWMSLTMQARMHGLYTHGMAGFHRDRVFAALGVPEDEYEPMCAIAVGRYGDLGDLPESLQEREKPNARKPLAEVALEGKYRK